MLLRGVLEMGEDLRVSKYSPSKGEVIPMIATVSLWFGDFWQGVLSMLAMRGGKESGRRAARCLTRLGAATTRREPHTVARTS